MPAAAPTATASVGDMSNQRTGNIATPIPRNIAGKIGPPRNPLARLMAYAIAFARRSTTRTEVDVSTTSPGIDACPEKSTSCAFAPSASAASAINPTASPPASRNAGIPIRVFPSARSQVALRFNGTTTRLVTMAMATASARSPGSTPS